MPEHERNWAGNVDYGAVTVEHPETVEQLQETVARADKVKAVGARHSFSPIAAADGGTLIVLDRFSHATTIDAARRTVTVDAGVTYGALALELQRAGFALRNMASLPHITVAGASATATHGSGERNGNLATAVAGLAVVTADGELVELRRDRDGERFLGAVVNLGGLGVVARLTLNIEPTYEMRQDVYLNLPFARLEEHFDALMGHAYSVSVFTDWRNETFNQVWLKSRLGADAIAELGPSLFGATPATTPRHPIDGHSAENCTGQMGVPGPWFERLPHFRMGSTPSSGDELQSEYLVPRRHALAAIRAISRLGDRLAPLLQISEVRAVAADDLWMSTCYQEDCVGLHFTWISDEAGVEQLLPAVEGELEPFEARPHWGKLTRMPAARVQALYPKLPAFRNLLHTYDPHGKFRNAFLDALL